MRMNKWDIICDTRKLPSMLTVEECSRLIRVSQVTVRKWCREGKLDAIQIGDVWRIYKKSLVKE